MTAKIHMAPLMGYTDVYFCKLMSLIAPKMALTSEMIHANAIIYGNKHKSFAPIASRMAIQIGGSEPAQLAQAAKMAEEIGFREINLNIGCPSERVQKGAFGACLMKEPELVSACINAIIESVDIPVTVKCRTGVDDCESNEFLIDFINKINQAGCNKCIIHARSAWLKGLSPKQNRLLPPLKYEKVYMIKELFPNMNIIINGGIENSDQVASHLTKVDGVMIGRWAIKDPWAMRELSKQDIDDYNLMSKAAVIEQYIIFIKAMRRPGSPSNILRHLTPLLKNCKGAKQWRRELAGIRSISQVSKLVQAAQNIV